MRIGFGFDIHRLVENRPLVLGGVRVPNPKGLEGHSDADVLLHAICDALLGAVGAGDMGVYFPDTDPKWKGTPSGQFVQTALELVASHGLAIGNVDLVLVAETPKLAPHREAIRKSIAGILKVKPEQVNVKGKTMEGLGEIGAGQAIAAYASVLLEKQS